MAINRKLFAVCLFFGVIFGQNLGFLPPVILTNEVILQFFAMDFKGMPPGFVLDTLMRVLSILNLAKLAVHLHYTNFWGHFGQNLGISIPEGPINEVTLKSFAINFFKKNFKIFLNAFLRLLCIINSPKLRVYLNYTKCWGHFWSKFGNFDPQGCR